MNPIDARGTARSASVPDGTPLARLRVPRLGVSAIVTEGVSSSVLRRSVGHVPTSAWPGESGNVALALQREGPLEPLENLHAGDVVVLTSASGRHLYTVEWTAPLAPGALEVLGDAGYPACTLVTERFVARGQLVR